MSGKYSPERFLIQFSSYLSREHGMEEECIGGLFIIDNVLVLGWVIG